MGTASLGFALTTVGAGTGLMTFPGPGLALYHFTITRTEAGKAGKITAAKHAFLPAGVATLTTGTRASGLLAGQALKATRVRRRPGALGP